MWVAHQMCDILLAACVLQKVIDGLRSTIFFWVGLCLHEVALVFLIFLLPRLPVKGGVTGEWILFLNFNRWPALFSYFNAITLLPCLILIFKLVTYLTDMSILFHLLRHLEVFLPNILIDETFAESLLLLDAHSRIHPCQTIYKFWLKVEENTRVSGTMPWLVGKSKPFLLSINVLCWNWVQFWFFSILANKKVSCIIPRSQRCIIYHKRSWLWYPNLASSHFYSFSKILNDW